MVGDEDGNAARGSHTPLLANIYVHYVFDLWIEVRRKKVATGDIVVVRYADDLVVGSNTERKRSDS
jgi:retron-type reverse transcriptase